VGGDFAGVGGGNRGKVEGLEDLEDALRADDFVEAPTVRVADIHVFNEPHVEVWLIESECDREDFVLVYGLSDNGIDFNGGKSEDCGGVDALQNDGRVAVRIAHSPECLWVEGVEADGDAAESGLMEARCFLMEEDAVGGEGEIGAGVLLGELCDEVGKVFSEEGFAAGQADFLCAEPNEDGCQARDFFVGENERAWEEGVVGSEDLSRHAVRAAKVTAVGDGDAEIPKGAAEEVCLGGVHVDSARLSDGFRKI
jgi:hypothetical protein